MPRSLFILLFLMQLYCRVCWAQNGGRALALLQKDAERIEERRTSYEKFIPQDLQKEMVILDSIVHQLCREGYGTGINCESVQLKVRRLKQNFLDLESKIARAGRELSLAGAALNNYSRDEQRGHPRYASYHTYRDQHISPHLDQYDQLVRQIRRTEIGIAKGMFRYLRHYTWKEGPIVTTLVNLYLKYNRQERIDPTEQQLDSLLHVIARQDATHQKRIHEFVAEGDQKAAEVARLSHIRDSLAAEQMDKNRYLGNLNQKLDSNQRALFYLQRQLKRLYDTIENKNLEYIARNEQLQLLAAQVSRVKQDRETALHKLGDMEGQLARKSTELGQLENALDQARADQKLRGYVINSLGFFVFVLLSYVFYKYKKRRYEWFAKMRLQKVNADLAVANEQLKEKKERLEALLRELHHRSKNNLQQISGLLYLHARQLRDDDARTALREARNRIDALGIVHRQLYQMPQQGLTSVNIADYAGELVDHLLNTHKLPRETIKTRYQLQQNLLIELDTATHIGLLLNELVTNSFKHAFPKVKHPLLDISIQARHNVLYLTVRDNGPGLPGDWSLQEVSSFGLKLVNLLVEQSEGKLRYDSREGACFMIDLPLKKNEYEIPAVL